MGRLLHGSVHAQCSVCNAIVVAARVGGQFHTQFGRISFSIQPLSRSQAKAGCHRHSGEARSVEGSSGAPMKHFRRLMSEAPTAPLLSELSAVSDAWAVATGRQDKIAVQREAMAVPLRGLRKSTIANRARRDVHESRWTNTSKPFQQARQFLTRFAKSQRGELGRAKLVLLPAGRRVYPHVDRGEYYLFRDRYHLVLKSTAGSWLRAGDEEVTMREGELWWFDNKAVHEAWNKGEEDRIHLIFDVLSREKKAELESVMVARGAAPIADASSGV